MKPLRLLVLAALALVICAAPASARLVHFTSPSGNIDCLGSTSAPASVSCYVQRTTWSRTPPRPSWCDVDWFPTEVGLSKRQTMVGSCRGDVGPTCFPGACGRLAYGRSLEIGSIRCSSATNGITCRYRTSPKVGFRVAREGYVLFRR
jgi:DNA-binding transcriptional regulator YdaS (Cro superfamily)